MTIRCYITPIFALTLLSALSERILAQEIRPDFSIGTPLPEGLFNPTAPDVSAMMRYGGRIGTSFYTGAAHLSIPVFDYENADISLPISLEYDCNGYKPGVTASTLGYGWHLSVGGAITRERSGKESTDPGILVMPMRSKTLSIWLSSQTLAPEPSDT